MCNTILHQGLSNIMDVAMFLCLWSEYDRDMKIMENNLVLLLFLTLSEPSELKIFLNITCCTSSQLLIASCSLWAEVPPTIFCMHTSMDQSYSTHTHSTHNLLHISSYWTWVADVTHSSLNCTVTYIWTLLLVLNATIGIHATFWYYICRWWLWISHFI
jgi:hypothetical protein